MLGVAWRWIIRELIAEKRADARGVGMIGAPVMETPCIVTTIRASIDNWGESSLDEGISSLLALGTTPCCETAPLVKTRLPCYRKDSKESAIDSFQTECVCD